MANGNNAVSDARNVDSARNAANSASRNLDRAVAAQDGTQADLDQANKTVRTANQGQSAMQQAAGARTIQRDVNSDRVNMDKAASALQSLRKRARGGTGMANNFGRQLMGVREAEEGAQAQVQGYNTELAAKRRKLADEMLSLQGELSGYVQSGQQPPQELMDRISDLENMEKDMRDSNLDIEQGDDVWSRQATDEKAFQDIQGKSGGMAAVNSKAFKEAKQAIEGFVEQRDEAKLANEMALDKLHEAQRTEEQANDAYQAANQRYELSSSIQEHTRKIQQVGQQAKELGNLIMNDPETKDFFKNHVQGAANAEILYNEMVSALGQANRNGEKVPEAVQTLMQAAAKLRNTQAQSKKTVDFQVKQYQNLTGESWYE